MIVEDEVIVAHSLKNTLEKMGYIISAIVVSGERAVEKARELLPDLILMDIKLKGDMDGIEAAELIKSEFSTPVVYLTAYGDEETMKRAKGTEPYGYILKPVEDRELRCNIEIALHKHQLEQRLQQNYEHLSSIINGVNEIVFSISSDKKITTWNTSIQQVSGYSFDEVKDKEIESIGVFKDVEQLVTIIDGLCNGESVSVQHISLWTKKGDRKVIQVFRPTVIHEPSKQGASVVFIGQDVTSRYEQFKTLRKGNGYVLMNEGDEEVLSLLKSVAEEEYHCLIVTRNNPTFINNVLDPFPVEIICMNRKNIANKNASGLDDVVSRINKFSRTHEHAAVLLSRIDYLMMTYSFDQLLKSIYEINEITSQSSSLFLLHVSDPSLFTDTQLRLLQSELTVIPGKTLKDYLPDLEQYTLFKYMKNEEKKYDTISFNQLRKKLDRSYPTIRKNAYSLKDKGFVEIVKKGREKIVFLTEKGKQIIKRCES